MSIDISIRRFGCPLELQDFIMPTIRQRRLVHAIYSRLLNADEASYSVFKHHVVPIKYPVPEGYEKWPYWLKVLALIGMDMHVLARHLVPPHFKLSICPLDYFKLPYETERDGIGDCEDTSFLLGAYLTALRASAPLFNYYACLGIAEVDGYAGGHAWIEYRGTRTVIYETTLEHAPWPNFWSYAAWHDAVLMKRVRYRPAVMFNDREVHIIDREVLEALIFEKLKNRIEKLTIGCMIRKLSGRKGK